VLQAFAAPLAAAVATGQAAEKEVKAADKALSDLKELQQKAADREAAKAKRALARVALAASRKAGREKRQEEKVLEAEAKKKRK
jgi:hypothetical protein